MPVTFPVADHASNAYETRFNPTVTTREDLFAQTCPDEAKLSSRIIQSSISESTFQESKIRPSVNGFVKSAWDAYSSHHHLTIRPDDIWFAILSQLNFYINANAEDLREYFVEHKDKKELIIEDVGTIDTVDFGAFARQMTGLIQQNVKDPNLRDWMMPAFSTTKVDDRTTAAILMMGSLQAYFSYTSMLTCGIPSVTLLGEREDYQDILERLDKLDELGPQTKDWAALLRPILRMFVASFDDAATSEVKDFWSKIAHYRGGSGMSHLSGWITAFCFWRKDGNSLYYRTAPKFHDAYTPNKVVNIRMGRCELGGVTYHTIDTHDIPNGFADVPVKVNDNGKIHETKMVAGSMAIQIDKSGDKGEDGEEKWDSVRSLSGWVMYKIKSKKEMDEARKEHAAKNPFGSQW